MNILRHIWLGVLILGGCSDRQTFADDCDRELVALNASKNDRVILVHLSYGPGFALVNNKCENLVPMDLSGIPDEEFAYVNGLMRELIIEQEDQKAYGVFEFACECDYDSKARVVVVKSISGFQLYKGVGGGQPPF